MHVIYGFTLVYIYIYKWHACPGSYNKTLARRGGGERGGEWEDERGVMEGLWGGRRNKERGEWEGGVGGVMVRERRKRRRRRRS